MPSFLDYQEKARKRTRLFVALHILCVAAIAFLVGALALATMWLVEGDGSDSIPRAFVDARLGPVAAVVGIVIAIVALATLYRTSQLRGGGGKVAESLGGRRVRADAPPLPPGSPFCWTKKKLSLPPPPGEKGAFWGGCGLAGARGVVAPAPRCWGGPPPCPTPGRR